MIYTNEIIKKKYEKKLIIKRLLKIVYVPIIAGIILITILAGYKKCVKHENNISILGFRQYVVATGSMEPEYNIGDVIIIREKPEEEIKIGDIINYTSENGIDTITHRVVDIIEKDGQNYYKTKGDNNNSEDSKLVDYSQVKGTLVFKISKLGTVITKMFTGTGITILFAVIILSYIRDKNKEEKIIARENARKLYNVPKYEENDS
ncbi:MAG TPA: signal peptidase I [Clostridiales bacterium]|nr:signal peptidase I [Clostridiales bacterium]